MESKKILFLTLTAFSQTGGIEKFNRCFAKVLNNLSDNNLIDASVSGLHDEKADERYISPARFKGYKHNKLHFVSSQLVKAGKFDTIILGHINLSVIAVNIKRFYKGKKLILIVHGIEAMEELKGQKKKALEICDEIWVVSEFTKQNLINRQKVNAAKIKVFFNTIDPFFNLPETFSKPKYLLDRYNIKDEQKILFTLTRLNYAEGYKGYDKVIKALPEVLKKFPQLKYFIAGKGEEKEINTIQQLIKQYQLEETVSLIGFLPESEVTDHYLMSDVFVMPSKKEGFGIVFIEALACGLNVIAGNKDGSVDALRNGELGTLIDPDDVGQLSKTIIKILEQRNNNTVDEIRKQTQQKLLSYFGFTHFQEIIRANLVDK